MHIVVVGLSHRTAPVEVREKLSIPDQSITESLKAFNVSNDSVMDWSGILNFSRTSTGAVR